MAAPLPAKMCCITEGVRENVKHLAWHYDTYSEEG